MKGIGASLGTTRGCRESGCDIATSAGGNSVNVGANGNLPDGITWAREDDGGPNPPRMDQAALQQQIDRVDSMSNWISKDVGNANSTEFRYGIHVSCGPLESGDSIEFN